MNLSGAGIAGIITKGIARKTIQFIGAENPIGSVQTEKGKTMADIEKVIKGLECEAYSEYARCNQCPYVKFHKCKTLLMRDALELLKEQEPKSVDEHGRMFTIRYGSCPNCLKQIDSDVNPKACGHCGQAVKWE